MSRLPIALVLVLVACAKKGDREPASSDLPRTEKPAETGGGAFGSGSDGGRRDKGGPVGGGIPGVSIDLDGEFEAVGAIDKGAVRKVVKDNVTKLQACYEQTLMANPGIAGTVTATFTIDNGSVTNVKASGVHPDVEVCVIKAVQLFKFPPGEKVDVSYPFNFKPAS